MKVTLLVEPHPGGHRLQAVANVAQVARRDSVVVLMTSVGATDDPAYEEFLGGVEHEVIEKFDSTTPSTRSVVNEINDFRHDRDEVVRVVLMDADQALKHWWWAAPLRFGLRRRPRIIFMLTRYPARLKWNDLVGWRLRIPKATLALLAMSTRSLHRVAGFSGRDDMSRGWIVKRTRDPAICSAHSRDRASLRKIHGLDPDRPLIGIFGGVSERKYPELVWEAMQSAGIVGDLLLAGGLSGGVADWVARTPPTANGHIVLRSGFLPNTTLDELVAAADVAALVMTNNGPSGIMGKALAAGVPVVTAGSQVRAREATATGGGESADFEAVSIGQALLRALNRQSGDVSGTIPVATAQEFAENLLGVQTSNRQGNPQGELSS